jgi:HupE / UreJ protein
MRLLCLTGWALGLAVAFIPKSLVLAHTTSISYSEIFFLEKTVQIRLRLNLYEVRFAAQLDGNSDRILSEAEVRSNFPLWVHKVFDCIQVENRGEAGKPSLGEFHFKPDTGALECLLSYSFSHVLEEVKFKVTLYNLTDSGHLNLALMQYDSKQEQRFFNLENTEARIEVFHGGTGLLRLWGRLLFAGGSRVIRNFECVAFLFALFLVGQDLKSRANVTGAFLLSATLTFLLGTLNLVVLPEKFVGSALALSVAYISIENLLIKELSTRWLIALFFGLIYGFGFSSPLLEMSTPQKNSVFWLSATSLGMILATTALAALSSVLGHFLGRLRFHKQFVMLASMILMGFGFLSFARRTF